MFEAFQIGPFFLWTHLIFLLIGGWLAAEFFFRLAQSATLSLQHFQEKSWLYLLSMFLAGRVFAVISDYRTYAHDPLRTFIFWDGGFSFLGAAVGIGIVLAFVTRGHRTTFLHWLDVLVPASCFGLSFAWLGAFFAGQSYGLPTDLPWGVTYDAMQVRYSVPLHPVQLYYAAFYFVLTFVLLVIRKYAKHVGTETLIGITVAALATFFLESFRGDLSVPVFATKLDFFVLIFLFVSLGVLAVLESRMASKISDRTFLIYELILGVTVTAFIGIRPFLDFEAFEMRFSQLLAILALLGVTVYVVVQRRKFPHL
jgi:phosphatidylglycerol:prolipoprotein diacylglycerol transferase